MVPANDIKRNIRTKEDSVADLRRAIEKARHQCAIADLEWEIAYKRCQIIDMQVEMKESEYRNLLRHTKGVV